MPHVKHVLAVTLLAAASYAMWQKLQVVAVVAVIGIVSVIYRTTARQLIDAALELARHTRQAKWGDLELQIDKKLERLSGVISTRVAWMQAVASRLESDQIGLLLQIQRSGRYAPPEAMKTKLRVLRNCGLIEHNAPTLAESREVWLSKAGEEFVAGIAAADPSFPPAA